MSQESKLTSVLSLHFDFDAKSLLCGMNPGSDRYLTPNPVQSLVDSLFAGWNSQESLKAITTGNLAKIDPRFTKADDVAKFAAKQRQTFRSEFRPGTDLWAALCGKSDKFIAIGPAPAKGRPDERLKIPVESIYAVLNLWCGTKANGMTVSGNRRMLALLFVLALEYAEAFAEALGEGKTNEDAEAVAKKTVKAHRIPVVFKSWDTFQDLTSEQITDNERVHQSNYTELDQVRLAVKIKRENWGLSKRDIARQIPGLRTVAKKTGELRINQRRASNATDRADLVIYADDGLDMNLLDRLTTDNVETYVEGGPVPVKRIAFEHVPFLIDATKEYSSTHAAILKAVYPDAIFSEGEAIGVDADCEALERYFRYIIEHSGSAKQALTIKQLRDAVAKIPSSKDVEVSLRRLYEVIAAGDPNALALPALKASSWATIVNRETAN